MPCRGSQSVVLGNQVTAPRSGRSGPAAGWIHVEGIDGWVTTSPGMLLTVTVADCIPVYLARPGQGHRAAPRGLAGHSWRAFWARAWAACSRLPAQNQAMS